MFENLFRISLPASGTWLVLAVLLCGSLIQGYAFYTNKVSHEASRGTVVPESFGFLKNQIVPYTIPTADGGLLSAWLVLPTKIYLKNDKILMQTWTLGELQEIARSILADDKNVVVLYFHDSSGSIAQIGRTEAYRSISAGDPDHIFLISFEYRAFGSSTDITSQKALVADAVTMIKWVHEKADIPFSRIALVGQNLGTAVAAAAVEHILHEDQYIEFAGLVLCASFAEASSFILPYSGWASKSLLSPWEHVDFVRKWYSKQSRGGWKTADHIKAIVHKSEALRLTMIETTSAHSTDLSATQAIVNVARKQLRKKGVVSETVLELGDAGSIREYHSGSGILRHVTLSYGNRRSIMRWMPVAFEVAKVIQNAGKE